MKKEAINQLARHLTKSMLTPDMRMAADVIGIRGVIVLSARLGGVWLYIPTPENLSKTKDGQLLLSALEKNEAFTLCDALEGVTINIPMLQNLGKEVLPQIIASEYDGENVKELALKYEMSLRKVENVIRLARMNKPLVKRSL